MAPSKVEMSAGRASMDAAFICIDDSDAPSGVGSRDHLDTRGIAALDDSQDCVIVGDSPQTTFSVDKVWRSSASFDVNAHIDQLTTKKLNEPSL